MSPPFIEEIAFLQQHTSIILGYEKEPFGELNDYSIEKLQSCLDQPFVSFGGKDLYETLEEKAAVMFYLLIKNHPLENGNKRTAVISVVLFFAKNGYWLNMKSDDVYSLALETAKSEAGEMDERVQFITSVFKVNIRPLGGLIDKLMAVFMGGRKTS